MQSHGICFLTLFPSQTQTLSDVLAYSFYCMVLLAALFTSTCYWQPLPIDTPLSYPNGNMTTFRDVMLANLSASIDQEVALPPFVQLSDRCWCDTSGLEGWETKSALRSLRDHEAELKRSKKAKEAKEQEVGHDSGPLASASSGIQSREGGKALGNYVEQDHFSFRRLRNFVFPTSSATAKYRLVSPTMPVSTSTAPTELDADSTSKVNPSEQRSLQSDNFTADAASAEPEQLPSNSSPRPQTMQKFFRSFYDLRPYGLDMTIDFSWS